MRGSAVPTPRGERALTPSASPAPRVKRAPLFAPLGPQLRGRLALLVVSMVLASLAIGACAQDASGREAAARATSSATATTADRAAATAGPTAAVKPASPGGATTPSEGAADGVVEAKVAGPAPLAVLAEAKDPDAPVVVQVLDARKVTADTVRIRLAFVSKAAEPPPSQSQSDPQAQPQPQAQTVPLFAVGTNPADFCLVTADGNRRLFLLRDAQNNPVLDGSLQPLRPGERRVLDAMFPAPPTPPAAQGQAGQSDRVTLHLGKLTLRNIPITLTK